MIVPNAGTLVGSGNSTIWKRNLHRPLIELGHDAVLFDFDYDEYFVRAKNAKWLDRNRTRFSEALWRGFSIEHQRRPFDFCFAYLCDGFVDSGVLHSIQKAGVPILNYSCNNIHQFSLVRKISTEVDCSVYAEAGAAPKFASLGVPAVQMQMAADHVFYSGKKADFHYDVTFVGQRYADRGALLAALVQNGINAQAFGPKWSGTQDLVGNVKFRDRLDKLVTIARESGPGTALNFALEHLNRRRHDRIQDTVLAGHVNGVLSDEDMVGVFTGSRINLGFATVYENAKAAGATALYHLRLRDFEVPMAGGFYLTRYTTELEEYFRVGKEIETYNSDIELIDKCHYYLRHPDHAAAIRAAGLARSLSEHTWSHRYDRLFSTPVVRHLLKGRGTS